MNETFIASELSIQLAYYLLLTAHVCLFVDISPLQTRPSCKLNYLLASVTSAAIPNIVMRSLTFPSLIYKHSVGVGIAIVLGVVFILAIQRFIKVDIDF